MPICLRVCLIMCIFALMKLTLKHIGMFFIMLFLSCALNAQRFVNVALDGAQTVCSIQQDSQGMMCLVQRMDFTAMMVIIVISNIQSILFLIPAFMQWL